jgi:hypothetical protein
MSGINGVTVVFKRSLWVCNGHISKEIKRVLWVCNGRLFKTHFGMSYLDDSFFHTHHRTTYITMNL